jgi:hypothetical protein
MLCSQNSGKYLSGTWHENRASAVEDTARFDSSDLSFLEMDGTLNGPIGKMEQFRNDMCMKTQPIDPLNWEQEDYEYNKENPAVGD